jgi:transcriptional regulator with XRE-family HTH domain
VFVGRIGEGLPPEFWAAPAVAAALASCDFAALLQEIRRARNWTQTELAEAVGYSQSWVSKVLRSRQALTLDQAREISRRLGIPVHLLRFGSLGGESPAKRRDFGKAIALALVPWPAPARADESTAPTLNAITNAQRRLDAMTPARELARSVIPHVEMANRTLGRARGPGVAADVAGALSEAAGLAGWLHTDMCDHGTARFYYRLAVDAARRAGHDLLAGYMLGSRAAFEIDTGDHVGGLGLITLAREQMAGENHPTPRAWLAAIEALGHASAHGGERAADDAVARAGAAVEAGWDMTEPPWPWIFPFDQAKLAGYRAMVYVRLGRPGAALAAFADSLMAPQPAPKQRAMIMLEVATAACQDGVTKKDTARVDEAFGLAAEALALGERYDSGRVIQRSRMFRRDYGGPVTSSVRAFDQRVQATFA